MQILDEVEFSKNYEKDFSYKIQDILIIMKTCFCGVNFLKNESFMPYHGKMKLLLCFFLWRKF